MEDDLGSSGPVLVLVAGREWLVGEGALGGFWVKDGDIVESWSSNSGDGASARTYLLIPAEVVTFCELLIPRNYLPKHRSSLPYLVDDVLLGDLALLHVAISQPSLPALERQRVGVVNKQLLLSALERTAAMGMRLRGVYADIDFIDQDNTLLIAGRRCLAKLQNGHLAADTHSAIWQDVLGQESMEGVKVLAPSGRVDACSGPSWRAADVQNLKESWDAYLARRVSTEHARNAINFLQGEFAPPDGRREILRRYCGVVAMAGIAMLVSGYFSAMAWVLEVRSSQVEQALTTKAATLLPEYTSKLGIQRQVEAFVKSLAVQGEPRKGFSEFIDVFYRSWKEASLGDAVLSGLLYSSASYSAKLDINNVSVGEVERLQAALKKEGLSSSVVSVSAAKSDSAKSALRLNVFLGKAE